MHRVAHTRIIPSDLAQTGHWPHGTGSAGSTPIALGHFALLLPKQPRHPCRLHVSFYSLDRGRGPRDNKIVSSNVPGSRQAEGPFAFSDIKVVIMRTVITLLLGASFQAAAMPPAPTKETCHERI